MKYYSYRWLSIHPAKPVHSMLENSLLENLQEALMANPTQTADVCAYTSLAPHTTTRPNYLLS